KGFPGVAEERCELRPRVRRAHVDDADGLDARPWRLCHDEVRDLAGLDAAPELLFRRDQNGEIKRVHWYGDLDPFAAAGNDGETEVRKWVTHMLCWTRHVLFSRRLLGKRPGQHKLGLEHGFRAFHNPIQGGRDPPPLKWSDLRYVFDIQEDCNGKEGIED